MKCCLARQNFLRCKGIWTVTIPRLDTTSIVDSLIVIGVMQLVCNIERAHESSEQG